MTHRFPLKEIARQSGLSTATIDRALNNRLHVSPQTKSRVAAAIKELENQEVHFAAKGRRLFFDFVIEAPKRFSREVQRAAEDTIGQLAGAVCRPRFTCQDIMSEEDVIQILERIAKRGSHGVCLKVRDVSSIRNAVEKLAATGIPVVTLVTDIQSPSRLAYVGLDNFSAGRTAAYLIAKSLGDTGGTILATRSSDLFLGEEEREAAFVQSMQHLCPNLNIVPMSGGAGVHYETTYVMERVVPQLSKLRAVYSMGGGNRTILDILQHNRLQPDLFIAHDLDQDNRALIQSGKIDFVLHHDLSVDLKNIFQVFLHHHKLAQQIPPNCISNIQIISPENIPHLI
ncbi:LacI family DNA-binding transcriptional regulator [Cochlodiniinecator piscidefendens]|uniref:LacI family DNA-binding transcriptional regulator n=1 Tax=Cochlodiniinecator piscidefendens TaxID=2715756 RepID=UPI0014073079|nr:LacI family DNA-binding transcriptional regulator [Cochlodiniinecator piscidefendens]